MKFQTATLTPAGTGDPDKDQQVYNGLDNCLTYEIFEALQEVQTAHLGGNAQNVIYDFERAMQAPALEMMLRGLRVDKFERDCAVDHLNNQLTRLQNLLNLYGAAIWDAPIKPRSPKLKDLFYEHMRLPTQYKNDKGVRKPSADRAALEKLRDNYFHATPVCNAILAFRDIAKQIEFLTSEVQSDGRIHTSYNVAGTETGRWSSSTDAFGFGANLQNFPDKLRRIFIADEGRKFSYNDLEQAESVCVGIKIFQLFGDSTYLDAIKSGDLHTTVARLVWRDLPWTGDIKADRKIAEQPFYRDYSYRDMAKRGGHGTNYYGTPPTMAKHLKVTTQMMEAFQDAYFTAFPGIPRWHRWVAQELQLSGHLTTLLGRRRDFFGRSWDDATLREAIAFEPQSLVGDLLNLAAWRIWAYGHEHDIRLMAQLHDAVLVDYPDEPDREAERQAFISELMRTELEVGGQKFAIGNDAATGWNWGKFNDNPGKGSLNPYGVKGFKDHETRAAPSRGRLDRVIPSFH